MLTNEDRSQHEWAAGEFCMAPPGANINASTHHCLNCQCRIHCAFWCGENWGEYIQSGRCKITTNQLSTAGQLSMQGDHELITICSMCLTALRALLPPDTFRPKRLGQKTRTQKKLYLS